MSRSPHLLAGREAEEAACDDVGAGLETLDNLDLVRDADAGLDRLALRLARFIDDPNEGAVAILAQGAEGDHQARNPSALEASPDELSIAGPGRDLIEGDLDLGLAASFGEGRVDA